MSSSKYVTFKDFKQVAVDAHTVKRESLSPRQFSGRSALGRCRMPQINLDACKCVFDKPKSQCLLKGSHAGAGGLFWVARLCIERCCLSSVTSIPTYTRSKNRLTLSRSALQIYKYFATYLRKPEI